MVHQMPWQMLQLNVRRSRNATAVAQNIVSTANKAGRTEGGYSRTAINAAKMAKAIM